MKRLYPHNKVSIPARYNYKTSCLDLRKIDRETHHLLGFGVFLGILFFSLLGYLYPYRKIMSSGAAARTEVRRTMIVNLIVIPKKTVPPENPQPEKKKEVKRLAAEHERVAPPVPVVEKTDSLESVLSENKVGSIQIEPWRTLPDLSSRGDLPETEKAPSDTIRMPVFFWQPKPSIEPEKKEPVPPEQAKDERREFKTDIFGIPLNGIVALPLHLGRHALKSIVWSIGDRKKRKSGGKTADGNFTGLTEKELRFLILVWRDGLLNPQKLSRHDRLFITNAAAAGEWMTNDEFLLRMEKRGLVTSLKVEGTRVFRTIFRREEIMQSLIEALKSAQDSPERQAVFENNIGLIVRCFDDFSGKVVIPE